MLASDQAFYGDFLQRAPNLLIAQTSRYLAQALSGQPAVTLYRVLLAQALQQLNKPQATFSSSERLEVAAFFMGLHADGPLAQAEAKEAPTLSFSAVSGPAGVTLGAQLRVNDAQLVSFRLLRAGWELPADGAGSNALRYLDIRSVAVGGIEYQAVAEFSNFSTLSKTIMVQPAALIHYGTGPASPTPATVALYASVQAQPSLTLGFDTLGQQQRMHLWVPAAAGELTRIVNEQFGPTNLLASFQHKSFTLGQQAGTLWSSFSTIKASDYQLQFTLTPSVV